jgi:hypothetical protein
MCTVNGKLPVEQAPTSILIQQKVNEPSGESRKTSTDALRKLLPSHPLADLYAFSHGELRGASDFILSCFFPFFRW